MKNKVKNTMKKRKINKIKKHQKHTRKHKKTIKQKRYYKNRKYSKKFKGGKICLEKDPTQCLVEVSKIDKKSSSGTGIILRSLSPPLGATGSTASSWSKMPKIFKGVSDEDSSSETGIISTSLSPPPGATGLTSSSWFEWPKTAKFVTGTDGKDHFYQYSPSYWLLGLTFSGSTGTKSSPPITNSLPIETPSPVVTTTEIPSESVKKIQPSVVTTETPSETVTEIVQPPPPSGPPPGPPPGPPARVTDEQIELFSELVKNGETDDVIREKMITSGLNEDDVNYLLNSNSNQSTPTSSPSVSSKLVTTTEIPPPPPPRPSVTTIGKGIPPPPPVSNNRPPPPPPVSNNRPPPPPPLSNNLQPMSFLQQLNNPEIQKTLKKPVVDVNIEKQKGKEKLTLFEKRFQGKDTTTENPKIYPTDISDDDENDDESDSSDDTKKGSYLKIDTFVNPELTQKMVDKYNKKNSIQNKKEIEEIPKKTAVSLGNIGNNENVIKMVKAVQAKDQSSDSYNDHDWDTDSQDGGKTGYRRSRKMKNVRKKRTNTRKKIRK